MCELSNTNRSISECPSSWEVGDITEAFTGKDYYQNLISQANSVSINKVIKSYKIRLLDGTTKITCPFKSHKGGRERTPSFQIFTHTNTFYCHGCSTGGKCADFVAKIDGISKVDAAYKILSLFESSFDESTYSDLQNTEERLNLLINFSDIVRNFRQNHFDEKSEIFIEDLCLIYDKMIAKHKLKLDNDILKSIIGKLIYVMNSYSSNCKL